MVYAALQSLEVVERQGWDKWQVSGKPWCSRAHSNPPPHSPAPHHHCQRQHSSQVKHNTASTHTKSIHSNKDSSAISLVNLVNPQRNDTQAEPHSETNNMHCTLICATDVAYSTQWN